MAAYINSLIAVIILAEIVTHLAPNETSGKKYVKLVCSLVVLLTMISPLKTVISNIPDRITDMTEYFTSVKEANNEEPEGFSAAAATLLSYLRDYFGEKAEHASVTFVTNEDDSIREAQFFLPCADEATGSRVRRMLENELSVTVKVFCGENAAERGE